MISPELHAMRASMFAKRQRINWLATTLALSALSLIHI